MSNQLRGNQVSSILNPVNGLRGELARKGIQPRNHMKDNLKIIKEKERENKEKKESQEEKKNVFKLSKFQNVSSTLKKNLEEMSQNPQETRVFMRAGSGARKREEIKLVNQIQALEEREKMTELLAATRKPPVPSSTVSSSSKQSVELEKKNYIAQNSRAAMTAKPSTKKEVKSENPKHEAFGKVPLYLQERKREKEEEMERQRMEEERNRDAIPGMILMPENERLETLQILYETKEKITNDLRSLPMICDTLGLRRRKTELETKLQEIEDALVIFSRTKVYIAE